MTNRIADWGSVTDRIDSADEVDFFTLSGVEPGTTVHLYMAGHGHADAGGDSRLEVIRFDGPQVALNNDINLRGNGTPPGYDISGIPQEGVSRYNAFISFEYQPGMIIKADFTFSGTRGGAYTLYASTGTLALNSQSPTSGNDVIEGGSGFDMIDGLGGDDIIRGLGGNDTLTGNAGSDFLSGDAGDDTLTGGAGGDTLDGGAGVDLARYAGSDAAVTVDLATVEASGGHAQGDTLRNVEDLEGSLHGDTLLGDDGDNRIEGLAGNDVVRGRSGDDTLHGGDGDDNLGGGAGADVLDGGAGRDLARYRGSDAGVTVNLATGQGSGAHAEGDQLNNIEDLEGSNHSDRLIGDDGANRLYGGAGNDGLYGRAGSDTLDGGAGNDRLGGGAGADVLDGGAGRDLARYAGSDAAVTVNLATGQGTGGHAQGDTLRNIEEIQGSNYNDRLFGDVGDNSLSGLDGHDTLHGGNGSDTLAGGAGNDYLSGGAGADVLDGGAGRDLALYRGSDAGVTVSLADGTGSGGHAQGDTFRDIENLWGSDHNDILNGNNGTNRLSGFSGDDTLHGGDGSDTLDGGDGRDTASYEESDAGVTVNLSTGRGSGGHAQGDTFRDIENLEGSNYNDRLIGDVGDNALSGLDGDDILNGGAGADVLDGGAGRDTVSYEGSGAGVTVDLATGRGFGGHAQYDRLSNIEDLEGSSYGDRLTGDHGDNYLFGNRGQDTLRGRAGNDILNGGAGNDTLTGGAGNDMLNGGAGADYLNGGDAGGWLNASGDGRDTASYEGSDAGVTVSLADGTGSGGHAQGDTFRDIENLWGSDHGDTLIGDGESNVLRGRSGDDTLTGGDGDDNLGGGRGSDTLNGGAGDDRLHGGLGADKLNGDDGRDTASYEGSDAGVTVSLAAGTGSGGHAQGDTFRDIENLWGSDHGDTLTGDHGDNVLSGLDGNDTLHGGDGNDDLDGGRGSDTLNGGSGVDRLHGGWGADILNGGDGRDTASYEGSDAGVTVNLATGRGSGGHAQGDTFRDIENISGSLHNDILNGNNGANRLRGRSGDDTLIGGAGADVLDGGDGQDTADYKGSNAGVTVNLATGRGSGGHAQGDTFRDIENLWGSDHGDTLIGDGESNVLRGRSGDDTLTGGDGDDNLGGGRGSDTLNGGAGDDRLHGGWGADKLNGDDGRDTADYRWSDAGVTVSLADGTGSGGHAQGDTFRDIENLWGSDHGDTLTGDHGDNVLSGLDGNDTLNGGDGRDTASYEGSDAGVTVNLSTGRGSGGHAQGDTFRDIENLWGSDHGDTLIGDAESNVLRGRSGDDTLHGGDGSDTLDGGYGRDTASYEGSDAGVTVSLADGTGSGGHAQGDTFRDVENLWGSDHGDVLTGDHGDNVLSGLDGNDKLYGGSGYDMLNGGAGADMLDGGPYRDTLDYSDSDAAVTVNLETGTASGGHAQGDTFRNIENLWGSGHGDTLTGDFDDNVLSGLDGNDTLIGGGGFDYLNGGAGEDRLIGGALADTLTGGEGADIFVFASFYEDLIEDFADGEDRIEISGGSFDDLTTMVDEKGTTVA